MHTTTQGHTPQQDHANILDDGYEQMGAVQKTISPVRHAGGALPATPSSDNSQLKSDWEQQQVELAMQESEKQYLVAGMTLVLDHPLQPPLQQPAQYQSEHQGSQRLQEEAAAVVEAGR